MSDIQVVSLSKFGASVGGRELASEIRETVLQQIRQAGKKVLFDFSGVHVISSGFADELFGKLFIKLGKESFKEKVKINKFDNEEDKRLISIIVKKALEFREANPDLTTY